MKHIINAKEQEVRSFIAKHKANISDYSIRGNLNEYTVTFEFTSNGISEYDINSHFFKYNPLSVGIL